ncbi:MAG: PAS domain-containing protein [Chloroflexi bacterium]|nr:PAS domain-containing protein [Chloroflexota bacterium]
MTENSIHDALVAWRAAERLWEATPTGAAGYGAATLQVVRTWLGYQEATLDPASGVFLLVVDDEHRYVAVSESVRAALGYAPSDLIGRTIFDLTASALQASAPAEWQQFLADGRLDGEYRLVTADHREVAVQYQARAHHPIPGFHLSRLWIEA